MTHEFDRLFQAHYDVLLAWCRRRTRPEWGEPEDIVHQAYVRCRKRWVEGISTPGREVAYLYRGLRWVLQDAARADRRRRERRKLIAELASRRTEAAPLRFDFLAGDVFEKLTPSERAVCWAYLHGQGSHEVSRDLGLSPGAVAAHSSRARQKLLTALRA